MDDAQRSNARDEEDAKPDDPDQPAENESLKSRVSDDDMIARLAKDLEKQLEIKRKLETKNRELEIYHRKLKKQLEAKRRELGIKDTADSASGEGLSSGPACDTEAPDQRAQAQ